MLKLRKLRLKLVFSTVPREDLILNVDNMTLIHPRDMTFSQFFKELWVGLADVDHSRRLDTDYHCLV